MKSGKSSNAEVTENDMESFLLADIVFISKLKMVYFLISALTRLPY